MTNRGIIFGLPDFLSVTRLVSFVTRLASIKRHFESHHMEILFMIKALTKPR